MDNPSWAEISHFTQFLNLQLESCERSNFMRIKNLFSGLKSFVVKFMIRMSEVCINLLAVY